jgi:regulator of telomere elongation helicase 1
MPYNYLIDPKIRENFKINYENCIIIMDEAHNVEKVSEDVASFEISISMFSNVLGELSTLCSQIEHSTFDASNPMSAQNNQQN